MRNRRKRRNCGIGAALALAAFCGAVMCVSFFSVKVLLFAAGLLRLMFGIRKMPAEE